MLSYIKSYRKLRGGKWYKVKTLFGRKKYTRTKPVDENKIIAKYRY